ncbi:hypothetical protein LEP1GSC052_0341 [Leptospira kmetyi serovar Malaysia str. Bejo-Iso9]|nr:hypothetical protein LEP1GSC052_0341 [Leptospira kmetyi serovar Malaysia str. Bejo-Iso9]
MNSKKTNSKSFLYELLRIYVGFSCQKVFSNPNYNGLRFASGSLNPKQNASLYSTQ